VADTCSACRERFETMRAKLNQGLKDVKKNKERVLAKVNEEYQDYINEVAQHAITNDELHAAVIRTIASSKKAMSNLGKSGEAMANLAESDAAMANLAQSDQAMMKILGPEMFQIWKARQSKPAE
jgi:transcriptional regulator NrdR family protein